jgi:hypothetical protein
MERDRPKLISGQTERSTQTSVSHNETKEGSLRSQNDGPCKAVSKAQSLQYLSIIMTVMGHSVPEG